MIKELSEKYIKDFDSWNKNKKSIDSRKTVPLFKEREIRWCFLGCNIGSEEDGKHEYFERPIIIFRIFNDDILWAIPLTTKSWPIESRIHYTFTLDGITRTAEIHQLRLISAKRLHKYVGTVSFDDFQKIRKYVMDLA